MTPARGHAGKHAWPGPSASTLPWAACRLTAPAISSPLGRSSAPFTSRRATARRWPAAWRHRGRGHRGGVARHAAHGRCGPAAGDARPRAQRQLRFHDAVSGRERPGICRHAGGRAARLRAGLRAAQADAVEGGRQRRAAATHAMGHRHRGRDASADLSRRTAHGGGIDRRRADPDRIRHRRWRHAAPRPGLARRAFGHRGAAIRKDNAGGCADWRWQA